MKQRKLLLFALALLLISIGVVAAQTATNYSTQRFVMVGGGSADSANYTVTSVLGQAATGVVDSPNYKITGGFLHPAQERSSSDQRLWLPLIR